MKKSMALPAAALLTVGLVGAAAPQSATAANDCSTYSAGCAPTFVHAKIPNQVRPGDRAHLTMKVGRAAGSPRAVSRPGVSGFVTASVKQVSGRGHFGWFKRKLYRGGTAEFSTPALTSKGKYRVVLRFVPTRRSHLRGSHASGTISVG